MYVCVCVCVCACVHACVRACVDKFSSIGQGMYVHTYIFFCWCLPAVSSLPQCM